jgi:BlaI family transcriptional regulator, penicillinase repressor
MARPPARELTERELEVLQVFWKLEEATAAEARDELARGGLDRAYTTVATLVRILLDKGFLSQQPGDRPFRYRPARSYEEVSRRLLGDLVERVFSGSREQLLVRLVEQKKLSAKERAALEAVLKTHGKSDS